MRDRSGRPRAAGAGGAAFLAAVAAIGHPGTAWAAELAAPSPYASHARAPVTPGGSRLPAQKSPPSSLGSSTPGAAAAAPAGPSDGFADAGGASSAYATNAYSAAPPAAAFGVAAPAPNAQ